jgi:RimJ/RimL family protein N-acetyltransferase
MIHTGNREHGVAVMEAIDSKFSPVTMEVISRVENGNLLGGVIYENYTGPGGSIEAHIAALAPRWLNRDFLYIMFDYPFRQLDCKQAFVRVDVRNDKSLNWCLSLGFKEYCRIEDVFPHGDMILLRMKRDECRFLNLKPRTVFSRRINDGQAESASAARL